MQEYKYQEIEDCLNDWLDNNDMTLEQAHEEYGWDLHSKVYNEDYFIIGYRNAEQWLIEDTGENRTFEVLGYVMEQEQENFGEIQTVFDNAETLVNHYAYWLGQTIVQSALDTLELQN
mgnify:FL=1